MSCNQTNKDIITAGLWIFWFFCLEVFHNCLLLSSKKLPTFDTLGLTDYLALKSTLTQIIVSSLLVTAKVCLLVKNMQRQAMCCDIKSKWTLKILIQSSQFLATMSQRGNIRAITHATSSNSCGYYYVISTRYNTVGQGKWASKHHLSSIYLLDPSHMNIIILWWDVKIEKTNGGILKNFKLINTNVTELDYFCHSSLAVGVVEQSARPSHNFGQS